MTNENGWRVRAGRRGTAAVLIAALAGIAAHGALAQEGPPTSVVDADKIEQDNALPITPFYDTPQTLASTKPGDLLRQEEFGGYDLPEGMKAVRVLYSSVGSDDKPVATSAVVLVPDGTPPEGGWPVVAWAHGTSGIARQCAPSAMKDVYYGGILFDMVKAGFAVVATDYHGLGTEGPHRYMDKVSQAYDVVYSVPAARAAVPQLGADWIVNGHSQGGLAAWGVGELQTKLKDPHYKGAVAVAGATHLSRLLTHPDETKGAGYYFAWHAAGINARYPEFQPSEMLSDAGLAHYADVGTKGCWFHGFATYAGVDDVAMLKPDWNKNQWVEKFYKENSPGGDPVEGSIFVIAGEVDTAVPIEGIRETVKRACDIKQAVTFRSYPGLDHDPTMSETLKDQIAWMQDRFSGKPDEGNCAQ